MIDHLANLPVRPVGLVVANYLQRSDTLATGWSRYRDATVHIRDIGVLTVVSNYN